jgi:hypothetical protein
LASLRPEKRDAGLDLIANLVVDAGLLRGRDFGFFYPAEIARELLRADRLPLPTSFSAAAAN